MTRTERIRELREDLPSEAELRYKTEQGWRLKAIEWHREVKQEPGAPRPFRQEPPFGLRVAEEATLLEEDPREAEALRLMLELVIEDEMSFAQVAATLEKRGYRTRDGKPWTPAQVFDMMPRLVEAAPRIMGSEDWQERWRRAS